MFTNLTETWMYQYDTEYRQQMKEYVKEERPTKALISQSQIDFFDIRGIVHQEFLPRSQTVITVFYIEVL